MRTVIKKTAIWQLAVALLIIIACTQGEQGGSYMKGFKEGCDLDGGCPPDPGSSECDLDDGCPPDPGSSEIRKFGFCDYGPINPWGGGCFEMSYETDCDLEWGHVVTVCPPESNTTPSSNSVRSSSSQARSSSSQARSSSSQARSSSSVRISSSARNSSSSIASVDYGFCDYGPITQYGGGCFKMGSLSDCDTEWGKIVSVCPSGSTSSSSSKTSGGNVVKGSFKDSRDSKTYSTVTIGTQIWMAENLNYNATNSRCYGDNTGGDSQNKCGTYGRLYDWITALDLTSSCNTMFCYSQINAKHRGICPEGWHVPTHAEWALLYHSVDGSGGTSSPYESSTAGWYLKATNGWNEGGGGQDTYGFAALPGGSGHEGDGFSFVGDRSFWWIAAEYAQYRGCYQILYNEFDYTAWSGINKESMASLRCVKD